MKQTWNRKVRPLRLNGDIAEITLSDGSIAVVDAADIALVERWNWTRTRDRVGRGINGRFVPLADCLQPPPPGMINDHRDSDNRNNRRSNLRFATAAENARNRRPIEGASSPFKGVCFRKDRGTWLACIRIGGRLRKLGTFTTQEKAARAYDKAAAEAFGEFARLNFPAKFGAEAPVGLAESMEGPGSTGRPPERATGPEQAAIAASS